MGNLCITRAIGEKLFIDVPPSHLPQRITIEMVPNPKNRQARMLISANERIRITREESRFQPVPANPPADRDRGI